MTSSNYVYVDEDGPVVHVFDSQGDIDPQDFESTDPAERRRCAESYARQQAEEIGCDWGTNYTHH